MFRLRDFIHLPQVDTLVSQILTELQGLLLVAGLDIPLIPGLGAGDAFLPSGRGTLFRTMMDELLEHDLHARCIAVVADKTTLRVNRAHRSRVRVHVVQPPATFGGLVYAAASTKPGLLVVDPLTKESLPAVLESAAAGVTILAQLDTPFTGSRALAQLVEMGVPVSALTGVRWVLSVERLPALCPICREPVELSPEEVSRLSADSSRWKLPQWDVFPQRTAAGPYYRAVGCPRCGGSGRSGDISVYDIFHNPTGSSPAPGSESVLPAEAYVLHLAAQGSLALDDYWNYESNRFRKAYKMYAHSANLQQNSHRDLERKILELETANRVLQHRTEALISLQELSQALISPASLAELARRATRQAQALCGADRVVLYYLQSKETCEVLASAGWDWRDFQAAIPAEGLLAPDGSQDTQIFRHYPPGLVAAVPRVSPIQAGYAVPLVAQGEKAGVMLVQSTSKPAFTPAETSLLQAFANQAAMAIQRTGLVEALQTKVWELEAAQVGLAQKERLEREMELARQVQQSVLPHSFPEIRGYTIAARNRPARRVGGDFYDVIQLDEEYFGVAIADVSDKGMPAALYMALTRSLLRAEARRERSPGKVVENVAALLAELGEPGLFVTLFYGVIHIPSGAMTYTRAGHDRPLLLRENTCTLLPGNGTPIGLLPPADSFFQEAAIDLEPGDRLVLYTDGLPDVVNAAGEQYSLRQFQQALLSYSGAVPAEMCAAIFDDLADYQGTAEQFDDMTILIVELAA